MVRGSGFFGDEKFNSLCFRVTSGALMFASLLVGVIATVLASRSCCGPKWDNSEAKRREMCAKDITDWEKFKDTGASDYSCYDKTITTITLASIAGAFLLSSIIVLCWNEMTTEKEEDPLEVARTYAQQERFEGIMQKADKKREDERQEKKHKRQMRDSQRQHDIEMANMEAEFEMAKKRESINMMHASQMYGQPQYIVAQPQHLQGSQGS